MSTTTVLTALGAVWLFGLWLSFVLRRWEQNARARRAVRPGNDSVIVSDSMEWRYEKAPRSDAQVLLLTIGDVLVRGFWRGELGDEFKAWHPVPKRNKERERQLGLLYSERKP